MLHAQLLDDERLAGVSDSAGWLYCRLLAYVGSQGHDGFAAYDIKTLAWRHRTTVKKLRTALEELVRRRMIALEGDLLRIVDWHLQADETSAERMRRYRKRKREETLVARTACARQTHGEHTGSIPEVDGDAELDIDAEGESGRPTLRSAISVDWLPKDDHREIAMKLGLDVMLEADKFRAHSEANGKELANWDAAFRGWLRRSPQFARTVRDHDRSRSDRNMDACLQAVTRLEAAQKRQEERRV